MKENILYIKNNIITLMCYNVIINNNNNICL